MKNKLLPQKLKKNCAKSITTHRIMLRRYWVLYGRHTAIMKDSISQISLNSSSLVNT